MPKRYSTPRAGQWIYPIRRGYKMACCDCGSVHRVNFKLVRDKLGRGKIMFQLFRDRRATAAVRRGAHKFIRGKDEE